MWGEEQHISSQSDSSEEEPETEGELDQEEQLEDRLEESETEGELDQEEQLQDWLEEQEEELGIEVAEGGEETGSEEKLPVALRRRQIKPPQRLDW